MEFCGHCGSRMTPDSKKKEMICGKCGSTSDIKVDEIRKKLGKYTKEVESIVIFDKNIDYSTRRSVNCPKCGYNEAFYVIIPPRWGDEAELIMYKCAKPGCGHNWREGYSQ
jgi:DNA-directed RNA polymerase subunit M